MNTSDTSEERIEEPLSVFQSILNQIILDEDNSEYNADYYKEYYIKIMTEALHQQLQKARHDWLREEIVKLGGVKRIADEVPDGLTDIWQKSHNQALQTIIDRYNSELDQDNN